MSAALQLFLHYIHIYRRERLSLSIVYIMMYILVSKLSPRAGAQRCSFQSGSSESKDQFPRAGKMAQYWCGTAIPIYDTCVPRPFCPFNAIPLYPRPEGSRVSIMHTKLPSRKFPALCCEIPYRNRRIACSAKSSQVWSLVLRLASRAGPPVQCCLQRNSSRRIPKWRVLGQISHMLVNIVRRPWIPATAALSLSSAAQSIRMCVRRETQNF